VAKRDGCPICSKPTEPEFKPFCSRGCKDRDLLQWLGEGYRVPGEPVDPMSQSGLDTGRDAD
jgi:endogenous inhibitor of DNA gyrase (YacG/DUF329 family)